jgi:N-methylhydantoinase B
LVDFAIWDDGFTRKSLNALVDIAFDSALGCRSVETIPRLDELGVGQSPRSNGAEVPTWDGRVHSYRPAPDWLERVSPKLNLHTDVDEELDPVTFEVIRNRLWTTNVAHGGTLTRISGSPIFQALDFNMAIMTESGEIVMNAPYLQCLVAGAPLALRFIMERFSDKPGIDDGDMFLATDPWVGALHQMDALIACPVFVDGKLFAWVTNAGHQYDLGGIVPGGWPQNAPDVFSDPVVLTPFKFVEKGVMRDDLELMFRRQSRMPDLVALDLRAQLAGCRFASEQLLEACGQFGPATVKAAMRQILDVAQRSFEAKLERIPDGRWSEVRYFDEKMPGDRSTYRMQLNATKAGGRVVFDNNGTEAQQEGPVNFVYAAYSGQILGVLAVTMLYEQLFSIGGAERQIDFDPTPGLMTCADFPASVSGGVMNVVSHTSAVMEIVGRMQTCDPELKSDVIAGGPGRPAIIIQGQDDLGNAFGTGMMDAGAAGSGARSFKDGVDTSGPTWSPLTKPTNIEDAERWYPFVYLYRRELEDGGGAGRWRGGTGMEFAITPYRANSITVITNTGGQDISTHGGMGLYGGYPSPTARYQILHGTDLDDHYTRRVMPSNVDDLDARERLLLRGKSNGTLLSPGDVLESRFVGGGGYGDPIEREPERVARDVAVGYVSAEAAAGIYGVLVEPDGTVDEAGTEARRRAIVAERAEWLPVRERLPVNGGDDDAFTPATGEGPREVHEYVVARDEEGRRVLGCTRCGHVLGDYAGNYKLGLLVDEADVTLIPLVQDPSFFIDAEIVFRRFCCPGCHVLMATEIVRPDEPALTEMQLLAAP